MSIDEKSVPFPKIFLNAKEPSTKAVPPERHSEECLEIPDNPTLGSSSRHERYSMVCQEMPDTLTLGSSSRHEQYSMVYQEMAGHSYTEQSCGVLPQRHIVERLVDNGHIYTPYRY